MLPLLIIGTGGHAQSLLATVHRHGGFRVVGLISSNNSTSSQIYDQQILGNETDVPKICRDYNVNNLLVAIGDNHLRKNTTKRLQQQIKNAKFPTLIDPTAVVAADAKVDPGVAIMAQAHIGAGCKLSTGVLVNTKASLDHNSSMSAFSSLAPGVVTGGKVKIEACTAIGLGAKLLNGIRIGSDSVVGAGSLVLRDIPKGVVAYGSPALVVRKREPGDPYL